MKYSEKIRHLIDNDEDYIHSPSNNNSLKEFVLNNPDGVDNDKIARVLLLSTEEVDLIYHQAILKIRNKLLKEGK